MEDVCCPNNACEPDKLDPAAPTALKLEPDDPKLEPDDDVFPTDATFACEPVEVKPAAPTFPPVNPKWKAVGGGKSETGTNTTDTPCEPNELELAAPLVDPERDSAEEACCPDDPNPTDEAP